MVSIKTLRPREFTYLQDRFDGIAGSVIAVTGRKCVGKRDLVLAAVEGFTHVYYRAFEGDFQENLRGFKEAAASALGDVGFVDLPDDWGTMLLNLAGRNCIVILDEVTHVHRADSTFPSRVSWALDQPGGSGLVLVLMGSTRVGMKKLVGDGTVLSSRIQRTMEMTPLPFGQTIRYLDWDDALEMMTVHCLVGGIPFYLDIFKEAGSVRDGIRAMLEPTSIMRQEGELIVRQEFPDIRTYNAIMAAIASGRETAGDIRAGVGGVKGDLTPYLHNLIDAGFIRRITPVGRDPKKFRRGHYRIIDPIVNFHYRFMVHHRSRLGTGIDKVLFRILSTLPDHLAPLFNDMAMELVRKRYPSHEVGPWWKADRSVDILAIDRRANEVILGATSWGSSSCEAGVLEHLEELAPRIPLTSGRTVQYLLVSPEGFCDELSSAAWSEDITLWDTNAIMNMVR